MTWDVTATRGSTIPNGGSERAHPAFMSEYGYSGDKRRKRGNRKCQLTHLRDEVTLRKINAGKASLLKLTQ